MRIKLKRSNLEKHIAMNSSFVIPQALAGSEGKYNLIIYNINLMKEI